MGVIRSTSLEFKSSITPSRLFKALTAEGHEIVPKAAPQSIKHVEVTEENGVKSLHTHFSDEAPFKFVKCQVDSIDIATYSTKFTLIEGDALGHKFEKVRLDAKIEATGDGGSILKQKIEIHHKGDADEVTDEEIKQGHDGSILLLKAIEAYLVANPNACA